MGTRVGLASTRAGCLCPTASPAWDPAPQIPSLCPTDAPRPTDPLRPAGGAPGEPPDTGTPPQALGRPLALGAPARAHGAVTHLEGWSRCQNKSWLPQGVCAPQHRARGLPSWGKAPSRWRGGSVLCPHPTGRSRIRCGETELLSSTPRAGVPHLRCRGGRELGTGGGSRHGAAHPCAPTASGAAWALLGGAGTVTGCPGDGLHKSGCKWTPRLGMPKVGGHRGATAPRHSALAGGAAPALPFPNQGPAGPLPERLRQRGRAQAGGSFSPHPLSPGVSPPGVASGCRQGRRSPPSATRLQGQGMPAQVPPSTPELIRQQMPPQHSP